MDLEKKNEKGTKENVTRATVPYMHMKSNEKRMRKVPNASSQVPQQPRSKSVNEYAPFEK